MIGANVRSVAIVGAGVAGLATAKTLLAAGLDLTVFERAERVGGVWADGYVGFGVQVQKELYQFADWPLPDDAPNFTPGPIFQRYLEGYADHFGIRPHLRLGAKVTALAPRRGSLPGWRLSWRQDGKESHADFDLIVIATGLYSETPNIPRIAGAERFTGRTLHISDLKTRAPLEGRRVAVLGYGKSATDAALAAADCAKETHLVFREPHWPVPRNLAGLVPFKWGMLSRMTASLVTPYLHPSPLARWLHAIGKPLPWVFWRLVEWLLIVQWGLGTHIARGRNLIPSTPVEIDCFGESTMVPRPDLYRAIRQGRIIAHRSEIAAFTPTGVILADGDSLGVDRVVFATGWRSEHAVLPPAVRAVLGSDDDGFYLYRHMLHPDVDNLVFVGRASSFSSILTYCLQARWLAELLAGRVRLPERAAILEEIERMKAWKRAWMPKSTARGARVLLHMMHYHDELLVDFGADPLRKRGVLAPLKEVLHPYQPSDYRDIVAGDWARIERGAGLTS
jgi:cation diffusion facilitator CzcD-associated flavoprotein CzcO